MLASAACHRATVQFTAMPHTAHTSARSTSNEAASPHSPFVDSLHFGARHRRAHPARNTCDGRVSHTHDARSDPQDGAPARPSLYSAQGSCRPPHCVPPTAGTAAPHGRAPRRPRKQRLKHMHGQILQIRSQAAHRGRRAHTPHPPAHRRRRRPPPRAPHGSCRTHARELARTRRVSARPPRVPAQPSAPPAAGRPGRSSAAPRSRA